MTHESKLQTKGMGSDQPEPTSDRLHQHDHRENRNYDNANERSSFELGSVCRITENRSTVRQDQNENQNDWRDQTVDHLHVDQQ